MTQARRGKLSPVTLWVWLCALLNAAGWGLSFFHALNRTGYVLVFGLIAVAGWVWREPLGFTEGIHLNFPRLRRRFSRALPGGFLLLAALALIGGVIHAPSNYDALAYRIPRVLHWLAEGRWHWIHTGFERLNTRGCGLEWISAPVIAFTGTDRLLFLTNVVSFFLLPGLIFGVLTGMGVRGRAAGAWMWVLPSGYCFVLQAGSVGNDLFTVPFVLAAVDAGLRAQRTGRRSWLWVALLATGLFTGVKANTLPLVLVCALVIAPSWRLLLDKPIQTILVLALCLACSFLPIALANWKHSGDWTGAKAEELPLYRGATWVRLTGNAAITAVANLTPPIAPHAAWWNEHVAARAVPDSLRETFSDAFPLPTPLLSIGELEVEEGAGLGFGVCVWLLVSWLAVRRASQAASPGSLSSPGGDRARWIFFMALAMALAAVLKTSFVKSTARLLSPYYLLLILPLLLHPAHARLVRRRWWKSGALAVMALAAVLLAVNPARPLLPVQSLVRLLRELGAPAPLCARAEKVYSVYGERADAFAPARRMLPADARVVGFVTFDDPEVSLWRPFGSRRIVHLTAADTPEKLRAQNIDYILANPEKVERVMRLPLAAWLVRVNGEVTGEITLTLRAGDGPRTWYWIKLRPPPA